MIVAFVGQKNGTGKTTLALSLAGEAYAQGRSTLMVDATSRQDLSAWARAATCPFPTLLHGGALRYEQLRELSLGFDLVVIDTDTDSYAKLLPFLDLAIIPCAPSPLEVWSLAQTWSQVRSAQKENSRLRSAVLINRYRSNTNLARAVWSDLRSNGYPLFPFPIADRVIFAESFAGGSTVSDYEPNGSAALSIRALLDYLPPLEAGDTATACWPH